MYMLIAHCTSPSSATVFPIRNSISVTLFSVHSALLVAIVYEPRLRVENVDIVSSVWCHSLNDIFNFMKIFAQFFSVYAKPDLPTKEMREETFCFLFALFSWRASFLSVHFAWWIRICVEWVDPNGRNENEFHLKFEFKHGSHRTRELYVTVKLIHFDDLLVDAKLPLNIHRHRSIASVAFVRWALKSAESLVTAFRFCMWWCMNVTAEHCISSLIHRNVIDLIRYPSHSMYARPT